jgi:hypothetical protein
MDEATGTVEELQAQLAALEATVASDAEIYNRARLVFDEEKALILERHEQYVDRMRNSNQERYEEQQEIINTIRNTDQGQARIDLDYANKRVESYAQQVTEYRGRMEQAESEKRRALTSAEGGPIHPEDHRVMHIWEKASRIASSQGYCSEYETIAEALGIPPVAIEWSGTAEVEVTMRISIASSGEADRADIASNEVDFGIDNEAVIEAIKNQIDELSHYDFEWEVGSVEIE